MRSIGWINSARVLALILSFTPSSCALQKNSALRKDDAVIPPHNWIDGGWLWMFISNLVIAFYKRKTSIVPLLCSCHQHKPKSFLLDFFIILVFFSFCLSSFPAQAQTPAWQQLTPAGGPPGVRLEHSAVYDGQGNKLIVYAGELGCCYDDVWVLANANGVGGTPAWTKLDPVGTKPLGWNSHTAVYDAASNRMIVFGGSTNIVGDLNDVWVLSHANGDGGPPGWSQLSPVGGPPAARAEHTAVYDDVTNRMIVFGGYASGTLLNDVWVLSNADGVSGTPTWSQLTTVGGPPPARYEHTAVYDPAANRMIVYGGFTGGTPGITDGLSDVWILENANGVGGTPPWRAPTLGGTPPPGGHYDHTAVYDTVSDTLLVFGSYQPSPHNRTWKLSNVSGLGGASPVWAEVVPNEPLPTPRQGHVAGYDRSTDRMIVFGGFDGSNTYLNDTWVLTDVRISVRRAIIIDIDGLRADILRNALQHPKQYPGIAALFGSRARIYTNAWTIFPSVTLAGHASIFVGAYPGKHGIVGNQWFDRTFNADHQIPNPYPCDGKSSSSQSQL